MFRYSVLTGRVLSRSAFRLDVSKPDLGIGALFEEVCEVSDFRPDDLEPEDARLDQKPEPNDVINALPLTKLGGLSSRDRWALKRVKITRTDQLLDAAGDVQARQALARRTGVLEMTLTEVVQRADLSRIKGIGTGFWYLLREAGIRDVQGLAQEDPSILRVQLKTLNDLTRILRRAPTDEEVVHWIAVAKRLPRRMNY